MHEHLPRSRTWDLNWIRTAEHFATFSKDPSTKVGAIAVDSSNQLLSSGWNGFPRGVADDERLLDREQKYPLVVHAEMNCVYNAARNGASLVGSTLYVSGLPVCEACALGVCQSGIAKVVMSYSGDMQEKWRESFERTKKVFDEVGVEYEIWHTPS